MINHYYRMSDTWQYVINTSSWVQITKNNDPMGPVPRWGHSAFLGSSPSSLVIFGMPPFLLNRETYRSLGGSFVGGAINPYYNGRLLKSISDNNVYNVCN